MKNTNLLTTVALILLSLAVWTFALRTVSGLRALVLQGTSDDSKIVNHTTELNDTEGGTEPPSPSLVIPVSFKMQSSSGAKIDKIRRTRWSDERIIPAKLELDPGRHYAVTAPADVVVEELLCPLGKTVQAGEPLLEMSSSQLTTLRGSLNRQQLLTEKARKSVQWHQEIQTRVNDIIAKIESNIDRPNRDWLPPPSVQTAEYGAKLLAAYAKYWSSFQIAQLSERAGNSGVMAEKSLIERTTEKESAKALLRGAIEQSRFDLQQAILSAESDLAASEGTLQSAQADMRRFLGLRTWSASTETKPHRPNLPDRFIHNSPGTGLVLERYFANGERAETGDLIVLVADIQMLWCVGDLRQGDWDLLQLNAGDEIEAEIVGLESIGHFPAKIEMLGGTVQTATGSISLTASITNNDLKLRPGMQSRLILRRPTEAIVVPSNAVFSNDGVDYIVKQEASESFRLVPVKTGRRIRNEVEILEGADADWAILVDGVFPIASQAFLEKE